MLVQRIHQHMSWGESFGKRQRRGPLQSLNYFFLSWSETAPGTLRMHCAAIMASCRDDQRKRLSMCSCHSSLLKQCPLKLPLSGKDCYCGLSGIYTRFSRWMTHTLTHLVSRVHVHKTERGSAAHLLQHQILHERVQLQQYATFARASTCTCVAGDALKAVCTSPP